MASALASRERLTSILLISMAFFCFSGLDATAKYLVQTLPSVQVVWFRFASHVVLALIFFQVWRYPSRLKTRRPWLQICRALFLLGSTTFNFFAVRYLQLAETVSIMFAAPFVVTALAGPLLGEWAGIRRWAAIIVGFIGVLIVTRPGLGAMHWAAILSVLSMLCYALYALTTRMMAGSESPAGMLLISGAVATLAMSPVALAEWVQPSGWGIWALLLSTGFYGCIGHWFLIKAHELSPAPVLAPFMYTQIVWMVSLGAIVFGDTPDIWTIVGASVIISSGLYILYRERRIKA